MTILKTKYSALVLDFVCAVGELKIEEHEFNNQYETWRFAQKYPELNGLTHFPIKSICVEVRLVTGHASWVTLVEGAVMPLLTPGHVLAKNIIEMHAKATAMREEIIRLLSEMPAHRILTI